MSGPEWRRICVDWQELLDAFEDVSGDHRYYLDRETGAVHFFSSYLDNEEEEEDERAITAEERYVQIPRVGASLPEDNLFEFIATLKREKERAMLSSTLRSPGGLERFERVVQALPAVRSEWTQFSHARRKARIEAWLSEVSVEPL